MCSVVERPNNLILAAVAADEYESIRSVLRSHPLRMRETLQEASDPSEFVYFPTSGIISALTVLENGMMIEFATVGHEGTTGVPLFLSMGDSNMALVSQMPGESLRMTRADFLEQLALCPSFASVMGRYSGLLLGLVAQSAACNRAHHADQRCARWLLMTHDQSASDRFPITQEFLAQMLGVSRPSVTLSAAALQAAGLISYHRGEVSIIDRKGLELASCECYAVVHEQFLRFAGPHEHTQRLLAAGAADSPTDAALSTPDAGGSARSVRSTRRPDERAWQEPRISMLTLNDKAAVARAPHSPPSDPSDVILQVPGSSTCETNVTCADC